MKRILLLLLLTLFTACGETTATRLALQQAEYQQTCYGDLTVKCRNMMVDLSIAKLKAGLENVKESKEKIVACQGQEVYEMGIHLVEEKIDYLDSIRPGLFFRTVLSGMEVEFNPPPFAHERELLTFIRSSRSCKK